MAKMSLVFLFLALTCVVEQAHGFGYYWQPVIGDQSLLNFQPLPPIASVPSADCDKKKKSEDSSSSSESSEEGSKKEEGSSSEDVSKAGESKEEGSKESEEEGSKESKESKEEGSKEGKEDGKKSENKEEGKKMEGGEEADQKNKEAPKKKEEKKRKYVFPPRTYSFPPRTTQQIVYSAPAAYQYIPYRSTYSLIQQAPSYPSKTAIQYISVPNLPTSKGYSSYSVPVSRIVSSPITSKVVSYALPTGNVFPAASNSYAVNPGASLVAASNAWKASGAFSYYTK